MERKKGDKAKVKSEQWWKENKIDNNSSYKTYVDIPGNFVFIEEMTAYLGKEVTITEVFESYCRIEEDGGKWMWNDSMFE